MGNSIKLIDLLDLMFYNMADHCALALVFFLMSWDSCLVLQSCIDNNAFKCLMWSNFDSFFSYHHSISVLCINILSNNSCVVATHEDCIVTMSILYVSSQNFHNRVSQLAISKRIQSLHEIFAKMSGCLQMLVQNCIDWQFVLLLP